MGKIINKGKRKKKKTEFPKFEIIEIGPYAAEQCQTYICPCY